MNKILVIISVSVIIAVIYMKKKSDDMKRKYESCQRRLLSLQSRNSAAPFQQPDFEEKTQFEPTVQTEEDDDETKPQLLNLATTAITPLIAFIGPNLLKKKSNFLNEMDASDLSLARQLQEMDESPKIVELEDDKVMTGLLEESKNLEKKLSRLDSYANGGDLPATSDFTFIDDEEHQRVEREMSEIQKELEETISTETADDCQNGVCPMPAPKKRGRKPKKIES